MSDYKYNENGYIDIEVKDLFTYEGTHGSGCIASSKITKEGYKVGYMYKEEASVVFPDSGWRFFAGDEDEDYSNDPDNFAIFDLNTICNYDQDVIKHLNLEENSYLIRINSTEFIEDDGQQEIHIEKRK